MESEETWSCWTSSQNFTLVRGIDDLMLNKEAEQELARMLGVLGRLMHPTMKI